MKHPRNVRCLPALAACLALLGSLAATATASTSRISTDSEGQQLDGDSSQAVSSATGRFVAFLSTAPTLVAGDTNGEFDVFLKDSTSNAVMRVNTTSDGRQTTGHNIGTDAIGSTIAISASGRYVAFDSDSSNLIKGDTNKDRDVFLKDTQTGQLLRVSTNTNGDAGRGASFSASISADGRYVAFASLAPNLVADDTNGRVDVFVKDTQTGQTTRASTTSSGGQGNGELYEAISSEFAEISANGRYVAFESAATNLVPGDANSQPDVFRKDLQTGAIQRASAAADGTGGNRWSHQPTISGDGRYVGFISTATNLESGVFDYDAVGLPVGNVFVKDLDTSRVSAVNRGPDGAAANGWSSDVSLNANGRFVAFDSTARNIASGDRDVQLDVYVKDRESGDTRLISARRDSTALRPPNGGAPVNSITPDGRLIFFNSGDSQFSVDDTNAHSDVFRASNELIVLQVGPPNQPPHTSQVPNLLPPIYHRPQTLDDYLHDPSWLKNAKRLRVVKHRKAAKRKRHKLSRNAKRHREQDREHKLLLKNL